jgi:hypothetical protein
MHMPVFIRREPIDTLIDRVMTVKQFSSCAAITSVEPGLGNIGVQHFMKDHTLYLLTLLYAAWVKPDTTGTVWERSRTRTMPRAWYTRIMILSCINLAPFHPDVPSSLVKELNGQRVFADCRARQLTTWAANNERAVSRDRHITGIIVAAHCSGEGIAGHAPVAALPVHAPNNGDYTAQWSEKTSVTTHGSIPDQTNHALLVLRWSSFRNRPRMRQASFRSNESRLKREYRRTAGNNHYLKVNKNERNCVHGRFESRPCYEPVRLPSPRLTLHSTKLCTKFKIFRKKIFLLLRLPLRHF